MSTKSILIKGYPSPNPKVENSSSRFTVKVIEVEDEAGNKIRQDIVEEANIKYEVCDFVYVEKTMSGKFEPQKTENGQPAIVSDRIFPYIPNPDLVELIRLVQILQRPVLLKGEPGSGKTQLSKALAYEWYGENYRNHYFEWHIKSTSKAVDGLYSFDHVARLRDVQLLHHLGNNNNIDADEVKRIKEVKTYRSFGPLAKAFLTSTRDNPSILIIDEIDKADIDFPNDLLLELDERRFTIPETGEMIQAQYPPIIFITSNDERQLPEAFLRRCLFSYIRFPDDTQLKKIIKAHIPGLIEKQTTFVNTAIKRFNKLREDINRDPADPKRVSTSELLDWLKAFNHDVNVSKTIKPEDLNNMGLEKLEHYTAALLKTIPGVTREKK